MIMGLEFAQGEPAGGRADHLHRAAGAAEVAEAAGGVRLVRRARRGVRHLAPRTARAGAGTSRPGGRATSSIVHQLGQTKKRLTPADVYTNDLVVAANKKADKATAIADAKAFKLNSTFQEVDPGNPNI